jgi:hypothetical protein
LGFVVGTDRNSLQKNHPFICPHCQAPAVAEFCGSAEWDGYGNQGLEAFPTQWRFVQCSVCRLPSIEWREDFGAGFDADQPAFLFPSPRRLSAAVPKELAEEWREAALCFEHRAYKATVVLVRRTLEGACQLAGIREKPLQKALAALQAAGKVDGVMAEWADMLRVIGNEGAHFTGHSVSRDDAADALAFAEALLDHIYVMRTRFDDLKARRSTM